MTTDRDSDERKPMTKAEERRWERYAADVQDLLGLNHWRVIFKFVDEFTSTTVPGLPENDTGTGEGRSRINTTYLTAHVYIRRGMSDDVTRETIAHEMCHVLLGPLDGAIGLICDHMLKPSQDKLARETFEQASEQVVELTSRMIANRIGPTASPGKRSQTRQEAPGRTEPSDPVV